MRDDQYWTIGRKEVICILGGTGMMALVSLVAQLAPPWWYLSLGRAAKGVARGAVPYFDKWAMYESQGGYAGFWLQSVLGWALLGAIAGLVFSNVVLRGKGIRD